MRQEKLENPHRLHLEIDKFDYYILRAKLVARQQSVVAWVREKIEEEIKDSRK